MGNQNRTAGGTAAHALNFSQTINNENEKTLDKSFNSNQRGQVDINTDSKKKEHNLEKIEKNKREEASKKGNEVNIKVTDETKRNKEGDNKKSGSKDAKVNGVGKTSQ